jgi:hypothetical protein
VASATPDPVSDALSVNYGASTLNTETDLAVVSCPGFSVETDTIDFRRLKQRANTAVMDCFNQTGVTNIQCKTNWNDNAQIPMLWNMLYSQAANGGGHPEGISIGRNGHALQNLAHFGYAFTTVPTNRLNSYNPNSTAVLRVRTMTVGNFWGLPSKQGVSQSIKAIHDRLSSIANVYPNVQDVGAYAAGNWEEVKAMFGLQ